MEKMPTRKLEPRVENEGETITAMAARLPCSTKNVTLRDFAATSSIAFRW